MSDEAMLEDIGLIEVKKCHRKVSLVKIPPDVYPHMIEAQVVPPAMGTVLLEWDKEEKKIKITIWDKNKPKSENKQTLWAKGTDSFKYAKLHYRKGNLVRVCR